MKAAYITQTGPADTILFGDLPAPTPTASQVLVKVGAVAVNPIDTDDCFEITDRWPHFASF